MAIAGRLREKVVSPSESVRCLIVKKVGSTSQGEAVQVAIEVIGLERRIGDCC